MATPENEGDFLTIAKAGTANHVERVVRGVRQALRTEDERAEDVENRWRAI